MEVETAACRGCGTLDTLTSLGADCANFEHSNWEAPEVKLLAPMRAILIAYVRKVPRAQVFGLYPSRICDFWSSEFRVPFHGILKKWNRAVCERYSAEPTRNCSPALAGAQWAVTVVPLSHSLSIVFVRKYRFLPFCFEQIQRKSRVRERTPHNAPRIRAGLEKKDQKAESKKNQTRRRYVEKTSIFFQTTGRHPPGARRETTEVKTRKC